MRAGWWWIDRWRKSTAYTDMSAEEQGVYRNLLDELWLREGALPTSEKALAQISGDFEAWPRVRTVVLARFYLTDDGYRNATHDEVMDQSLAFKARQREKGQKRAAQAKRGPGGTFQPNQPETSRDTSQGTSRDHQPETSLPSPSPSQSKDPSPEPSPLKGSVALTHDNGKAAREVFAYFQQQHPRARLTAKRRKLINDRLRDYSVADLCLAIDGLHLDRWHNDTNNLTIEYAIRNAEKIEKLQAIASDPGNLSRVDAPALSDKTQASVRAGQAWLQKDERRLLSDGG